LDTQEPRVLRIITVTHSTQDDPMATADASTNLAENKENIRAEWLGRLSDLVETIRGWAEELDWSTRRIETKMDDLEIGDYKAPALIIQKETVRAILQPIGRSAPDVAGVVDFYIMPAYDDIARLTFYDDSWHLRHMFPGSPDVGPRRRDQPLSRETFQAVLEAMMRHAA
jgi:hypothetical protein